MTGRGSGGAGGQGGKGGRSSSGRRSPAPPRYGDDKPKGRGAPSGKGPPSRKAGALARGPKKTAKSDAPEHAPANAPATRPKPARRGPPREPGGGGVGGSVKAAPEGAIRIQRALARAGLASRREADRAVAEGRVEVNGVTALIGQTVDPAVDRVTLDGRPVTLLVESHRWIVLNKPAATMTTRKDPQGRKTVFDLVDAVPGLVYVGRLDYMTEGVLLLTTDGRAAHALTHPSSEVERVYLATVRGDAPGAVRAARRGVELEDGLVQPRDVSATPLGDRRWAFQLTIAEGRTHEVRRLCDALGLEVERLVRTSFGPVRLGELPSGATRALTPKEREVLEALAPAPARGARRPGA